VGSVAAGVHRFLNYLPLVVALVQAQMLRSFLRRLGTLDDDGVERGREQLEVGNVGSGHDHRKRSS